MISFFDRTKGLDKHLAHVCRWRAARMRIQDVKWHGGKDECGDVRNMRTLASMFSNHKPTIEIWEFMNDKDTAWRDEVPRNVWEIMEENYKNVTAE